MLELECHPVLRYTIRIEIRVSRVVVPSMKRFNTTGLCVPTKHYMVDISERIRQIKSMVDDGDYFCINRARQYGKTTTLVELEKLLQMFYIVIDLDFQDLGEASFSDEYNFSGAFATAFCEGYFEQMNSEGTDACSERVHALEDAAEQKKMPLLFLFRRIMEICSLSRKPIVLMIDEVDSAANNQVFLDFLAQLRSLYLKREKGKRVGTFQSVILAGVTDVRHLKDKLRPDGAHKVNSPWNIAADFNIDMSLSADGIQGMLNEYEADHHTGMDTAEMAKQLRAYTSGYPYLVSRLCQLMDGEVSQTKGSLSAAWTEQGMDEAVKMVLADRDSSLFGSLMGKLTNSPKLKGQLRRILMQGDVIPWLPDDEEQQMLSMYGFIRRERNSIVIANRIFEMRLYQYFLGESTRNEAYRQDALTHKSIFINEDQSLNMPLILEHFVKAQRQIHGDADEAFLEAEGRERFLTYLSPIINGTGTYSIEEQTRDRRRMDVVIHYLGKQYVVELKIWRGQRYNADGEKQILAYLDYFGLTTGYMVSFNFNQKKEPGVKRLTFGDRVLFEATV